MFEKFDKDGNYRLSAEELANAVEKASNRSIKLDQQEIETIRDYFQNRHQMSELSRAGFHELMNTKFTNKHDEGEAKKSLGQLKIRCDNTKVKLQKHMQDHNSEKTEKINLRSFKIAINNLQCMTLYNIDNLAKYMDTENEGFILISKFIKDVQNASTGFNDSFKKTASSKMDFSASRGRKDTASGDLSESRTTMRSNTRVNKWGGRP